MTLPFFYITEYDASQKRIELDPGTSRHVVQVLRMKQGEPLNLTDGKGALLTCEIDAINKKNCMVTVIETRNEKAGTRNITVAISLLKNTNRFEWFLEKATEIGVRKIIPLICERTEKEKFRFERMQGILVSAMLQSQQCWLPVLHEPARFEDLMMRRFEDAIKYIAYCTDGEKQQLADLQISKSSNCLIAVGPEGDFTEQEIRSALQQNFVPVSLGETRLRTETAGIVAATLLCCK